MLGVIEKALHQGMQGLKNATNVSNARARINYTHPVGLGRPAILQAPFPGPDGNNS